MSYKREFAAGSHGGSSWQESNFLKQMIYNCHANHSQRFASLSLSLSRQHSEIQCMHCHTGAVETHLHKLWPWLCRCHSHMDHSSQFSTGRTSQRTPAVQHAMTGDKLAQQFRQLEHLWNIFRAALGFHGYKQNRIDFRPVDSLQRNLNQFFTTCRYRLLSDELTVSIKIQFNFPRPVGIDCRHLGRPSALHVLHMEAGTLREH